MILFTLQFKPETRIVAGFNKRFFENLITHKTSPQAGSIKTLSLIQTEKAFSGT